MQKILLLSVITSTMMIAGGHIAPENGKNVFVPELPEIMETSTSDWTTKGHMVAYYQSNELSGAGDLGSNKTSWLDFAIQLKSENKDLFAGIGAGVELTGLYSPVDKVTARRLHTTGTEHRVGGAITQAYLTYGLGNSSLKVGRQYLPRALSPFAFTESWTPVKNSFDAALFVNTDVPDTTIVLAGVRKANRVLGDLNHFQKFHGSDVAGMVTLQNKSLPGLTLTGSYYLLPDAVPKGDAQAFWGDAQFKISDYTIGVQGGEISADGLDSIPALGAKVSAKVGIFDAMLAYAKVGAATDQALSISNHAGAGIHTPLYTQSVLNQGSIKRDADSIKVAVGVKALGGRLGLTYTYADMGETAAQSIIMPHSNTGKAGVYQDIDLTYKTSITKSTTLLLAYINQNDDRLVDEQANNLVRVWVRHNF